MFGFLLGTTIAGGSLYYYVVDQYKVANELLVEDIYVSSMEDGRERSADLEDSGATISCAEVRGICQGFGGAGEDEEMSWPHDERQERKTI